MKVCFLILFVALLVPHAIDAFPKRNKVRPDCREYDDGETVPDRTSCSRYYLCIGGRALRKSCARGLYYDARSGFCNRAFLVDCEINKLLNYENFIDINPNVDVDLEIDYEGQSRTTPCALETTTTNLPPCDSSNERTTPPTTKCSSITTTTTTTCATTTTTTTSTTTTTTTCSTTTSTTTTKTTTTKTTTTTTKTTTCSTTTTAKTTTTTTKTTTCSTTTTTTPKPTTTTTPSCPTTTTESCSTGTTTKTTTTKTTTTKTTTTKTTTTKTTTTKTTTTKTTTTKTTTCSTTPACTTTPSCTNTPGKFIDKPLQYLSSTKDCATLADGTILLDFNHCRRYYICENHRAKRTRCAIGLWFDSTARQCLPRSQVTNCIAGRN